MVITCAIDLRDGVFIVWYHLHQKFQHMPNTELTLDQLQSINGASMHQGAVNSFQVKDLAESLRTKERSWFL